MTYEWPLNLLRIIIQHNCRGFWEAELFHSGSGYRNWNCNAKNAVQVLASYKPYLVNSKYVCTMYFHLLI